MSAAEDFDWNDADVVIPVQMPVAVYTNPIGNIVIRQEGDYYRKEDAWIVILPENVRKVVDAMLALVGPEVATQLILPAPADRTAAERQRRHRQRTRNGPCDRDTVTGTVTPRDAPIPFEVHPPD